MGYTLTIGEHTMDIYKDGLYTSFQHDAEGVTLPEAPAFGEPTDNTNSRCPSYISWGNAMRFVGLHDLMKNEDTGLLRNHPGCVPLVKEHLEIIEKAKKDFYLKYPHAVAGFSETDENWPEENSSAARLEWLHFWVKWALENCKVPVFYNS